MKKIYILLLFITVHSFALAQKPAQNNPDPTVKQSPVMEAPLVAVVNFSELEEDWDPVLKTVRKIHVPGVDLEKDRFLELKKEANENRSHWEGEMKTGAAGDPPVKGYNFYGNSTDGSVPADNGIAVSKGGKIVSVSNTRIHMYTETGTQLGASSLYTFAVSSGMSGFPFDPRVTYDPVNDRFIVVFLSGSSPSSSKVVLAFSQTNDPSGNWNFYTLPGNINGNGVWTDFPTIGQSSQELFVTGNPFTSGGGSDGGAMWQIDKYDGYAGNSLTYVLYENPYFSLHPVEGGLNMYGPNFYFVRTETGSGTIINLHQVTNTIANGGVLNAPVAFAMSTGYGIPPDAEQKSTSQTIQCNDTRVQSSYFENNRIQFAFNTGNGGVPAIYFGTGELSAFDLSFSYFHGEVITLPGYDIAYPSLAYAGSQHSSGINRTFVAFNYAGPNHYPGCGAVYYDETGVSNIMVARAGLSWINDGRWGDYADIAERHNNPGEAWMNGTYGNSSNTQRTYISQLYLPGTVENDQAFENQVEMKIYPNPVTNYVSFEFPVNEDGEYTMIIRDLTGKKVKSFVENRLFPGTAKLSFNAEHLASGTYVVSVENKNAVLFSEKFSVNH